MKKLRVLLAMLAIAALFGLMVGCGGAPEEKAEAPATEEAAPAAEAKTVNVGFVYVSPIGDAGYSWAHDQGRLFIDKEDWITSSYAESVPEGADAERVIRNFARKDFDLVFATSFGYMDPMLKVAGEFPDKAFMHCSGFKSADNMSNYFGRMYQARYLTGITAGSMTKTNKIGYVAAMQIPEVIRGINAFTLGAQSVNPDVEVVVVWTNTWYDPVLEKDSAVSLLDAGCDIIAQHQDSPGPQEAAEERGAYSVGYNSDMSSFAPKAHLTSAIWNWGPLYLEIAQQVRDGSFKGGQSLWLGMDKGAVDIAPFGAMVPEAVQEVVLAKKAEIASGNDMVFVGPIVDQAGNEQVAAGATADDGMLLGMKFFVKGVTGSID